ncbi:MAG: cytidylate kinase-like family protein [Oscillospiraceae bacterium]|nr:cytidylate kinase-like family protein [Oscillospiraceae bacterium]
MNKNTVIVIGRQFGAGGREIGRGVASKLGIPFYDKELLAEAARKSGLSDQFLAAFDEVKTTSLLYSFVMHGQNSGFFNSRDNLGLMAYEAQVAALRNVASRGPCVIVGRGADYILKDEYDVVSIFITGSTDDRINHVMQRDGVSAKEARQKTERMDKNRASYYSELTGHKWGAAANYDLCVNGWKLGIDKSVELIASFVNAR